MGVYSHSIYFITAVHTLYIPALVATRFNPDFKAKYNQLRANGKPAKVGITVIERKLMTLPPRLNPV